MIHLLPVVNTVLILVLVGMALFGIREVMGLVRQLTAMQGVVVGMMSQALRLLDQGAEGAAVIATNLSESIHRADVSDGVPGAAADAALKSGADNGTS